MQYIQDLAELRLQLKQWRQAGEAIALVPTMGNLHAGHLALVSEARRHADRCVVSIFVNPMQFGEGEDFASYPRTLDEDRRRLEEAGAHLLFNPEVGQVYPQGQETQTRVEVPGLSDILCGASRPGHFVGVTTVVCKLFNMVQPDLAVFGEKDFQQLMLIRRMVADLAMPIEIKGVATIREADGLAMSSRNGYLTQAERLVAPLLHETLQLMRAEVEAGLSDYSELEAQAQERLSEAGFQPDYLTVRRAGDLSLPSETDRDLVILTAARLGKARLIDNLPFQKP
jgi:pantoate--beta-alanine ligase